MGSQVINWITTVVHLSTPVCGLMKETIKVEALEREDNFFLRKKRVEHRKLVRKAADSRDDEARERLQDLLDEIDRLIMRVAQIRSPPDNFNEFDVEWKFDVLRKLLKKQ